jgi:hypothetical protein
MSDSCHDKNCRCKCHHQTSYTEELLDIADEAWHEILKENIKEEIRKHSGDHIAKLAVLVAKANHDLWKDTIDQKEKREEFEENLDKYFRE